MASIERTAYPRLKKHFTKSELHLFYTPTLEEIFFVRETARNDEPHLHLLVQLKTFQRLGYFPPLEDVPEAVIAHLRSALHLPEECLPLVIQRTLYRHQNAVCRFLNVKSYGESARKLIIKTVFEAAQVMDNPADLINAAIEELIKERFELPAFSTLDRLVRRIRSLVNRHLWNSISDRLTSDEKSRLDDLLLPDEKAFRTPYNSLKQLPKKPTLAHLQELLAHLEWLLGLGSFDSAVNDIPPLKIKHFAGEAKVLDAGELKDFNEPKRYALLVCLIRRAHIKTCDAIARMFIRRIAKLHQNVKNALQAIQIKHLEKSERLVTIFSSILENVDLQQTDAEVGNSLKNILGSHSVPALLEDCGQLQAFHGNNHFPLLWKFYRSHRSALFRLITALEFKSTSRDDSMQKALEYLIENESRRSDHLEASVSLSFTEEKWHGIVLKTVGGEMFYDRKLFEVCVFSHLAQELKSGDIAITGSEEYGDYRLGLLHWKECEPMLEEFCLEVGLPKTAAAFVERLKEELSTKADEIDKSYPKNSALTIDEKGELVLKKGEKRDSPVTAKKLEAAILERMPERNLLDILSHIQFYTRYMRHFGPMSGSGPKLDRLVERYLLTLFTYVLQSRSGTSRPAYARNCYASYARLCQQTPRQCHKTRCRSG